MIISTSCTLALAYQYEGPGNGVAQITMVRLAFYQLALGEFQLAGYC